MTDRKMLKLAAKAAGIKALRCPNGVLRDCTGLDPAMNIFSAPEWNPLTDDGDAFRLMCALYLEPKPNATDGAAYCDGFYEIHHFGEIQSAAEATRLVIVRAAAEIGKGIVLEPSTSDLPEDNYYKTQEEAFAFGRKMK